MGARDGAGRRSRRPSQPARRIGVAVAAALLAAGAAAHAGWLDRIGRGRLVAKLSDDDARVRARAARALGRDGSVHSAEPLASRLPEEPDPKAREAIAGALGAIGDARAVPALVRVLGRAGDPARAAAAKALGRIGDPDAVEPLAAATLDRRVRAAALEALSEMSDRALVHALAMLRDPARSTGGVRILGAIGDPRATAVLISTLRDPRADLRAAAAEALGTSRDVRALRALEEARRDSDPDVRQAATEAIERIFPSPPVEANAPREVDVEDASARRRAVASIVAAADLSRVPSLVHLASREGPARLDALRCLAILLHPRPTMGYAPEVPTSVVDLVGRLVRGESQALAASAAFAAGAIRIEALADDVASRLANARGNAWTRRAAALALGRLGRVEELRRAADREREPVVRAGIARALGETGSRRAVPALRRMLRRDDDAAAGAATSLAWLGATQAAPDLRGALDSGSAPVRAAAAGALARLADRSSLSRVRTLADEDSSSLVRAAAAQEAGPIPRGEAILWYRSGSGEETAGRRVVVVTPENRVYVEWTDLEGDLVIFDVALGLARVTPARGEAELVPTR